MKRSRENRRRNTKAVKSANSFRRFPRDFFESKSNKNNRYEREETKLPDFNNPQPSVELENRNNIKIRDKILSKTPVRNFRYYVSKDHSRKQQRKPMTDRYIQKSRANISMEDMEWLTKIEDEDFTQRVYGAWNQLKRRSHTNQGTRSRNNGKKRQNFLSD